MANGVTVMSAKFKKRGTHMAKNRKAGRSNGRGSPRADGREGDQPGWFSCASPAVIARMREEEESQSSQEAQQTK